VSLDRAAAVIDGIPGSALKEDSAPVQNPTPKTVTAPKARILRFSARCRAFFSIAPIQAANNTVMVPFTELIIR
jgi:hypothetical protein